jgi:hypothetical protein
MKQRSALIIAAGLTAFILVIVGGVAGANARLNAAAAPATLDPALQAQIQQREMAYQQLVQQANDQLTQAYKQLGAQQVQTQPAQSSTTYPVSPDLAAALALNLIPGANLTRRPELVDFHGAVAYEVVLDRGTLYIDATSASLLYSSVAPTSNSLAYSGESGEHEQDE